MAVRLVRSVAVAVLLLALLPGQAATADCEFVLGFKALRDLIPERVGECLDGESHNPDNGDGRQHTTAWHGRGGLLVWRKADNWTAFTDGATTWINGPSGLVSRPNAGPLFPWESPAAAPPPARPAGDITLGPWRWERTERSDGTTIRPPDPGRYTVTFQPDGRLAIQADCNRAGGTYTLEGQRLTLQLGPTTLIGCPPGSQGSVFLRDLANVATYVFDGATLVLNLRVDSGNMVFSPQPPAALTSGTWRLQTYRDGAGGTARPVPQAVATATFAADGSLSGDTGCNIYRGPYSVGGSRISIGDLAVTRRGCAAPILAQEQAFLAALRAATTYEVVGDRLTLRDGGGEVATFVRPSIQPIIPAGPSPGRPP